MENTAFVELNSRVIAVINAPEPVITDTRSANDLMAELGYNHDCYHLALAKSALCEDFFRLSTGIAGDILQKFTTYSFKLAVFGDYSGYTSKPLRDFIYECGTGGNIYFTACEAEAVEWLAKA